MCQHSPALTVETILADTLVRMVMASDGVSADELRIVFENASRAVAARERDGTAATTAARRQAMEVEELLIGFC